MLLQGKNLSEDEFNRLLKAHQEEIAALERNYGNERSRQKKALDEKVRWTELTWNGRRLCFLILDKNSIAGIHPRIISMLLRFGGQITQVRRLDDFWHLMAAMAVDTGSCFNPMRGGRYIWHDLEFWCVATAT